MRTRMLALGLLVALGGGLAVAHGSKVHIRGTVEKISTDSLQVRTPDGKTVELKLAASTVYVLHANEKAGVRRPGDEDRPAKGSDLAVGDLVVIHATPKGSALEADEVKFSLPPKPKS